MNTHDKKQLPTASMSLDLDNKWSYLKTHGESGWESFPSYLSVVVPRILEFLDEFDLKITFFISLILLQDSQGLLSAPKEIQRFRDYPSKSVRY